MPLLSKLSYWIGQALDNSAGTHPPGWVAFQRWSATASQWQSKDASDTALWQGRANTAYDSGTWGVGNTWQTDYNNELAAYNAEVAAYNAALAPVAADQIIGTTINTGLNGGISGFGQGDELLRLTIDRTGYWAFAGYIQCGASGDGDTVWLTIMSGGTTLGSHSFGFAANVGVNSAGSGVFADPVLLTSGAVVSLFGGKNGSQQVPTLTQEALRGWFIPTQAHPH